MYKAKQLLTLALEKAHLTRPTCLLYHRVIPQEQLKANTFFSGLTVGAESFDKQLNFIRKHRKPVSVATMLDQLTSGKLCNTSTCITFDDGYLDNLTNALPVLERYEIPATIFITNNLKENPALIWWYQLESSVLNSTSGCINHGSTKISWQANSTSKNQALQALNDLCKSSPPAICQSIIQQLPTASANLPQVLDLEQIKVLANHPLIEIGAHTLNHYSLSSLDQQTMEEEILVGTDKLEKVIGKPITLFAYPYGGAAEAGTREYQFVATQKRFRAAFTTIPGHLTPKASLAALPRVVVDGRDNLWHFRWKLSGGYVWRYHQTAPANTTAETTQKAVASATRSA